MNKEKFFQNVIEMLPDPFFAIDKDGKLILWNSAMESLTKVKKEEVLGKGDYTHSEIFYGYKRPTLADLVIKPDEEAEKKYYINFLRNEDGAVEAETYSPKMDYYDWGKAVPIFDDMGEIEAVVSISRDISDIKRFQKQQDILLKRYETLFVNSPDAIACLDKNHIIFDVNESFLKIFGFLKEECIGKNLDDLIIPRKLREEAVQRTNELFEKGIVDTEAIRYTKTGTPIVVNIRAILMKIEDELMGGYAIYTDVTERAKYKDELESTNAELEATIEQLVANEEELRAQYDEIQEYSGKIEYLANHDPLTGLYSRRKFTEILTNELKKNNKGAVFLLDIDDFKNINDVFGHIYGDELLKRLAALTMDLAAEKTIPFRFGGDEFLILIKEEEPSKIREYAQNLKEAYNERIILDNIENSITVTMGIVQYPKDGDNIDELMIKADIAMYSAKKSGKNRYLFFDEKMKDKFSDKINKENTLRKALKNDNFLLLYQPIVETKTGDTSSFEALLRIKDSSISPDEFIPIAEETGLILPIGKWVIKEAVRQISQWAKKGYKPLPVSINLSPRQFYDVSLVEYIGKILEHYCVDPSLMEIEITENIFAEKKDGIIYILNRLKALGVRISLDDFGTGYSSLNYLTFMPLDRIKLDKSLKDKFIELKSIKVMESLIALAHGLNLKVVTEGGEEIEEFRRMKRAGSDYLQGYLFSKPISQEEAEKILNKNYSDLLTKQGTKV